MPYPISSQIASNECWQKNIDTVNDGSYDIKQEIYAALGENRGSLIGRHGTIELTQMLIFDKTGTIDSEKAKVLELNAGIFPRDDTILKQWCQEYSSATKEANIIAAGWYKPLANVEWNYLDKVNPSAKRIPLRSLEPYYSMPHSHWTVALERQHVVVVSSFTESMQKQIFYKDQIWPQCKSLLPNNVQWSFVKSYYCPATAKGMCQWPDQIRSWKDAVDSMEKEVLNTGAKIALIGCGGLAMPLALRLKQKGIIAIVLGGAIQILFGIKGRRWRNHPIISKFYTSDWLHPNLAEIPGNANEIEGGCYW